MKEDQKNDKDPFAEFDAAHALSADVEYEGNVADFGFASSETIATETSLEKAVRLASDDEKRSYILAELIQDTRDMILVLDEFWRELPKDMNENTKQQLLVMWFTFTFLTERTI